jgi:hypothetical protein
MCVRSHVRWRVYACLYILYVFRNTSVHTHTRLVTIHPLWLTLPRPQTRVLHWCVADESSSLVLYCSETTLTGESRFHISPPGDLNLWPLWREANRLVHWTSETWWESCETAGSPQGSPPPPPAANSVGCEARRETCIECETGIEKLCEIKWECHIVSMRAYWQLGTKPCWWSITSGSPM